MAAPQLGRYIVLPVLLLLFYVGSGFRIRDAGQTGSLEHVGSCTLAHGKCSEDSPLLQTSSNLPRRRFGVGENPRGRITGGSQQPPVEANDDFQKFRIRPRILEKRSKEIWKIKVDKESDIGDRDNKSDEMTADDDSDEAVVEVDDEMDTQNDYYKNTIVFDKKKEVKRDSKLNFKSGQRFSREPDNDENDNLKASSIYKRIDANRRPKGDSEREENRSDDLEKILNGSREDVIRDEDESRKNDRYSKENVIENSEDASLEKQNIDESLEGKDKKEENLVEVTSPIEKINQSQLTNDHEIHIEKAGFDEVVNEIIEEKIKKMPVQANVKTMDEAKSKSPAKAVTPLEQVEVQHKNVEKKDVQKAEKKVVQKKTERKVVNQPKIALKSEPKIEQKMKTSEEKRQLEASISLNELNDLVLRIPNFVPNFTAAEDSVCKQHGKIFLRQLRGYKLWALQNGYSNTFECPSQTKNFLQLCVSVLDSSAKIPSGLLRGNVNQLGDFDQCLGISARVRVDEKTTTNIQGKYCVASIDLQAAIPETKVPVNLMQSRGFLRGNMRDTGHFVPKFTTINWAICIPGSCSAEEAQRTIESGLEHLNGTSGLKFIVHVDPNMCYIQEKSQSYSKETIGVLYFYAMIICLVIIATLRDYIVTSEKPNYSERIIMSFSLRRTVKSLTKPNKPNSGEISCIHGIRSLATIALYVAHKMIPIASMPYANRIVWTEIANNPLSSLLRVSLVYTDSFLMLSGVLTAFNMASESTKRGEIRWFCRFVARFIRLTPALLVVIFWYAYVMEHTGSGPQWNSIIKVNADLCKKNSWTNLLYIQNFFPFEEMCATHTHQLALDMQLSLLSPILVFFLQIKSIIGVLLIFFLLQVSATIRYFATMNNYLSLVIFHGMTSKHLYKTANLTYAVSLHRATPYLLGVGLGVLLHYTGKNVKIYKVFVVLGWIIATLLGAWSLFSPWRMARKDYIYDPEDAAHYAVLGPIAWALALFWVIFACFTDHGGIINRFLSNYWFVFFSRISYSVYLTQFAVFFYNLASTRYSSEFQVLRVIDPYEAIAVTLVSVVLTLFFDIPMQEIKNVLMESTDVPMTEKNAEGSKVKLMSEINYVINDEQKLSRVLKVESNEREVFRQMDNNLESHERKLSGKHKMFVQQQACDDFERDTRRSKSIQRTIFIDPDTGVREMTPIGHNELVRRDRRSSSRQFESSRRDRSSSRLSESRTLVKSDARTREKSPRLRKTPVRLISSGSEEEEVLPTRGKSPRRPVERPRVSDEEDWEQELRIRRRKFLERMASEEKEQKNEEDELRDLSRRSSAEGKIALLKGPTGSRVMEAWTVSKGPRISLESSQGPTDTEDENRFSRDFGDEQRDKKTEDYQAVSSEPIESFVFRRESKSKTLMDLRKLTNEEQEMTPVPTGKLFKRESIVKSQASEEDPEYLLPERPKLVKQEQEHPFKKAWQMQKSRSEEDGPAAFAIKDPRSQSDVSLKNEDQSSSPPGGPAENPFHLIVEDVDSTIWKAPSEESRSTSARSSEDMESSMQSRKIDSEEFSRSTRSANGTESPKSEWLSEDEQFGEYRRQRRESETWQWESDE